MTMIVVILMMMVVMWGVFRFPKNGLGNQTLGWRWRGETVALSVDLFLYTSVWHFLTWSFLTVSLIFSGRPMIIYKAGFCGATEGKLQTGLSDLVTDHLIFSLIIWSSDHLIFSRNSTLINSGLLNRFTGAGKWSLARTKEKNCSCDLVRFCVIHLYLQIRPFSWGLLDQGVLIAHLDDFCHCF